MTHQPSISPPSPVIVGIAAGSKSARSRSAIQSTIPPSSARRVRNQFEVDPGGRPARSSTRAWLNARTPSAPSSSSAASSARSRVAAGMDTPFREEYYDHSTPPRERGVHAHARAPHHPFLRRLGLVTAAAGGPRLRPSRRRDARPSHSRRRHRRGRTGRAVARISSALVAVARDRSGHRGRRLPRPLPRPARGRLDRGRRSAYRTRDPAPRPARPLRRPPHRARPPNLPRLGRPHRDAADLRPPRAGSNGSAALRLSGLHEVQPEAPPGPPAPALVHLAPPGRLTARNLLRALRRPPDIGGSRRSPPRPDAPTRHRRRGAYADPRHSPARSHAHDPRRLPPPAAHGAGPRRVRPPRPPLHRGAPGAHLPQSGAVR